MNNGQIEYISNNGINDDYIQQYYHGALSTITKKDNKDLDLDLLDKKSPQQKKNKSSPKKEDESKNNLISKEDQIITSVKWHIFKQFFSYIHNKNYISYILIIFLALIYIITQILWFITDYILTKWFDHQNYSFNYYFLICILFLFFAFFRSYLLVKFLIYISKNLHIELLNKLLLASINKYYDITPVGRIMNRFSKDLDRIDLILCGNLSESITHLFSLISALILCIAANYYFLIFLLPILLLFYYISFYKFKLPSQNLKRLEAISKSPLTSLLSESLIGLSTIRSFNKIKYTLNEYESYLIKNARLYFAIWTTNRWLATRLDMLAQSLVFIIGFITIYLNPIKNNTIIIGLALIYTMRITSLLQWATRVSIETLNDMTSAERLLSLLDIPIENYHTNKNNVKNSLINLNGGDIKFNQVYMKYRKNLPYAINNLNITFYYGKKTAIIGRTGSGKSSILKLLYRIIELDQGNININNYNIADLNLNLLRSNLSIIPQDPVLFTGSIQYNLDPFNKYTKDQYWNVLKRVYLDIQFKQQNINIYDTNYVQENGNNFSAGEKQLLCIARALLNNNQIILFDEATSSVDHNTDQKIQLTMRENFNQNYTVITIAHRIETIMDYDYICIMDQGKCIEYDLLHNLINNSNSIFFKKFYQQQ